MTKEERIDKSKGIIGPCSVRKGRGLLSCIFRRVVLHFN